MKVGSTYISPRSLAQAKPRYSCRAVSMSCKGWLEGKNSGGAKSLISRPRQSEGAAIGSRPCLRKFFAKGPLINCLRPDNPTGG
jgi:hypothetical protein